MGKLLFYIITIPIFLGLLGFAIKVIFFPAHVASTILKSQYDIVDKTFTADNEISNYEWFKQTYEDIKATENKIRISESSIKDFLSISGEKSTWDYEDKTEYSRLQSVKQGQMSYLEDLMAQYNARSKMANRVIFRDGFLPAVLELGKNILVPQ